MGKKQEVIWNRKELKENALSVIKKNVWTLLFIGFLMSTIFGEYTITRSSNDSLDTLNKAIKAVENGETVELLEEDENGKKQLSEYTDEIVNIVLFGSKEGTISDINEKYGITHGVFYGFFDFITRSRVQLRNVVDSIANIEIKLKFTRIVVLLTSLAGVLVKIFVVNPITIGEDRIFLESKMYKDTRLNRILFAFTRRRYFKTVRSVFRKNLYKVLWDLTIIGGFIKGYSYKMVSFIIAENPEIKGKDAIKISRVMMDGNKLEVFKLDLSFILWHILQILTFGLAGFWVNTYTKATSAELYSKLREDYINNKKYNYELLNDEKLYSNAELTKYPDEQTRKEINYKYNYRPSSIILFFFTFAFAGWLWEVLLYLFRDGILVNRGTSYGPWLPIYGFSCTAVILLVTRFEKFRNLTKNPFAMFIFIMLFSTLAEYVTSWFIEMVSGLKYWDYSGVFMNINGRVCLECSLFFGVGGSMCLYLVAPFLERQFEKLTLKVRITICLILVSLFGIDELYSVKHPNQGEGITSSVSQVEVYSVSIDGVRSDIEVLKSIRSHIYNNKIFNA